MNKSFPATLALIAVTAVWGSTFFLIKDILGVMTPLNFLGLRFLIGGFLVAVVFFPALRKATKKTWIHGFIIGGFYATAQLMQTFGLQYADASISGFLTGTYVVLTPLVVWLLFREQIAPLTIIATIIAAIGMAVLSVHGFSIGYGEFLTFIGAIFYALHIAVIGHWVRGDDAMALAVIQLIAIGIFCFLAALPFGVTIPRSPILWAKMGYLIVFAGVGAIVVQTWAQKYISAPRAAIVMTMEPVFAATFAVALGGEPLTYRLLIGGSLILFAMVSTEAYSTWRLRRLNRLTKSPHE